MAISVGWSEGVVAKTREVVIRFDPQTKKILNSHNFISHSHGDHVCGLNLSANNYLTFETQDILFFKGNNSSESFKPVKYGEKTRLGDLEVIAHNAGHILGSAQFEVRSPNLTLVYTGDINCRNMLTTEAADVIPCDVLVLETTYGRPHYVFPSLGETCAEMVDWALGCLKEGKVPVFQVYSTGKAQEVIKIFNEFTNVPVVVPLAVAKVNQAYEKNGVKLAYTISNSGEGREVLRSKQCVLVVPTRRVDFPVQAYSLAVATGWALKFRSSKFGRAFPLSGHADFSQLVAYVKQVKPKKVFTIHGFKGDFANYLSRKLGIRARPIMPIRQRPLHEYL